MTPHENGFTRERLVNARLILDMTQQDVALELGIHEGAVRNWERGVHQPNERLMREVMELIEGAEDGTRISQTIGQREVCWLRESLGETQEEFARRIGVAEATISRWENGRISVSRRIQRELRPLLNRQLRRHHLTAVPELAETA